MPSRRTRTALYSDARRRELADAVIAARTYAGWDNTTDLIKAVGRGARAIYALENAEPTVGQTILSAVGRTLGTQVAGWTSDTPRLILEGHAPPALKPHGLPKGEQSTEDLPELERQQFLMARDFMRTQGRELTVRMWRIMQDEYERLAEIERSKEPGHAR